MPTEKTPKIKAVNIIQIHGNEVSTYNGKIDYAHQVGIKSLEASLIQAPTAENGNTCICQARLETASGQVFSDIADATPDNVPRGCTGNFIRVASTRAKSRVLQDAFNIASSLDEEYGKDNTTQAIDVEYSISEPIQNPILSSKSSSSNKPISEKQSNWINNLAAVDGLTGDDVANREYGKDLAECVYIEADKLIKKMRTNS